MIFSGGRDRLLLSPGASAFRGGFVVLALPEPLEEPLQAIDHDALLHRLVAFLDAEVFVHVRLDESKVLDFALRLFQLTEHTVLV